MKLKGTRKGLKKVKTENLQQLVKISCLTKDLEMIGNAPKESVEALKHLREVALDNTKIVKEKLTLKEQVESLRLVALIEPPSRAL